MREYSNQDNIKKEIPYKCIQMQVTTNYYKGCQDSNNAELWEIIHGAKIALARGFSKAIFESNSEIAIRFFDKGCQDLNPSAPFVGKDNMVVDSVAKNGLSLLLSLKFYDILSLFYLVPFMFDSYHTLYLRT